MKKIAAVIFTITILIGCTGCGKSENKLVASGETIGEENSVKIDSNPGITDGNVKSVLENYDADFELCKNTEYVNLDWSNAGKCSVYPAPELYDIEYKATFGITEMPQKEMLDKFKEYCLYYFGECLDEFAFFEADETIGGTRPQQVVVDGVSYRGYYRISDNREKLENGSIKINWLVYRNIEKNQYLWWAYGLYPHWINKGGALTVIGDKTNRCSSWIPSDLGEPTARYYNDGKSDDVKYRLADDEVSIGEAIRYFTEEYPSTLPLFTDEDKPSYAVKYVEVYKITDDTYAYLLRCSTRYDSISFELGTEMVSNSPIPDYYTQDGQALMIRKNEIDAAVDCDPVTNIKKIGEPLSSILSLKEVSDIVSEELSQNVKLGVVSTELIYHGTRDKENIAHLKPTWQFVLYNENDGMNYNAYVDAATGDFNYFRYSTD